MLAVDSLDLSDWSPSGPRDHQGTISGAAGSRGTCDERPTISPAVCSHVFRYGCDFSGQFHRAANAYRRVVLHRHGVRNGGFGDITALSEVARARVTGQMVVGIVIVGLGARIIVDAVKHGRRQLPVQEGDAGADTDVVRRRPSGHMVEEPGLAPSLPRAGLSAGGVLAIADAEPAARLLMTKATATATTTCGVTATPSTPIKTTARSVEVNGSRNMAAHMAPMPMPIPAAKFMPGNALAAIPSAAPMNIDGKTGPPRNAPREPVHEGLAHNEQDHHADRIVGGFLDQLGCVLSGEQHLRKTASGDELVCHRSKADDQAECGSNQQAVQVHDLTKP